MPRPQRLLPHKRPAHALALMNGAGASTSGGGEGQHQGGAGTIDRFYLSRHCAVCDALTHSSRPLCDECLSNPLLAAAVLSSRWNRLERQHVQLARVCCHCGGSGGRNVDQGGIICDSLDCGVYYERRKVWQEMTTASKQAKVGLGALSDW